MSHSELSKLLTKGLQEGFGGGTTFSKIERGGFTLTSSHLESSEGIYHDEWATGGGQEIIKLVDGQMMTRVYAGDTVSSTVLESLGISEKDVMGFLKKVIVENGDKIRLDTDFDFADGDWNYKYTVTKKREDPFLISGDEEIFYKCKLVFIHIFTISRVREG